MKRRTFVKALAGGSLLALIAEASLANKTKYNLRYLRPPGSLGEEEFTARCIRCGQCAEICPNDCINYFGLDNGLASLDTPYLIPREKACILCMKCGEVCPTGAIQKIEREAGAILKNVKMGKARVNRNLCLSWQGKSCGVCYRACPLQDISIRVGYMEQPHMMDGCIGCGLCERACIQMPQAIRVIPDQTRDTSA